MFTSKQKNLLLFILAIPFYAGCTVGPDYQPPQPDVPDQWHQQLVEGFQVDGSMPMQWWQLIDDPILSDLITQARQNNPDLGSAYWNLVQARYWRDYVTGNYDPSVNAVGSYTRSEYSENGFFGAGSSDPFDTYSVGFDAVWEFDVFGRFKRAEESAQASYEAQVENYRDVMVSLSAEVARNYVELRTVQARIEYTLQNIESQEGTLELANARFRSELVSRLDVEQAKLNLTDTQSQVPPLRSREQAAMNRLCVLVGKNPGQLQDLLADSKQIPSLPENVSISMPADLLRQRPDIRRAERELAAQSAQIGYATAYLYPSFSLTGNIGLEAMDFSNLFERGSRNYGFGPSFRWNIFNGGRIRNQIRIEESKSEFLYQQYRSAVLTALEEVESTLTDYMQELQRMTSLQESVAAAKESVDLVRDQYKNGLTDFQNVLILQRSQLVQEDKLVQSEGQVILNLIRLYKALGGWGEALPQAEGQDVQSPDRQDELTNGSI